MLVENPLALSYIFTDDLYTIAQETMVVAPREEAETTISIPQTETTVIPVQEQAIPVSTPAIAIPVVRLPEVTKPVSTPVIETPAITFNYTGGNQKNFLVLVHYPEHDLMELSHLAALENTIKRKELSLDDIAILNISKHSDAAYADMINFFKPQRLLLMGKAALPKGLATPAPNKIVKVDGCAILFTYSFTGMMGNKDYTKAFWEQMKNL